jgi:hypothetical protein
MSNGTQQYKATANYANGDAKDITGSAIWASSNKSVATIASGGLATGVSTGTTTITAASGATISPEVTLTVF